jgi:hypothetical protein
VQVDQAEAGLGARLTGVDRLYRQQIGCDEHDD